MAHIDQDHQKRVRFGAGNESSPFRFEFVRFVFQNHAHAKIPTHDDILSAVSLPPSIWAAETPSEKADALLDGLIETNDPGLAVLVAQNGKILFEKGYGLADREHMFPSSRKPPSASARLPSNSRRRRF